MFKKDTNIKKLRKPIIIFIIITIVFLIFIAPTALLDRYSTITDFSESESVSSNMDRYTLLKIGIRMALDNPILGIGINNFSKTFMQYARLDEMQLLSSEVFFGSHNQYLHIWHEAGIMGFIGLLLLIFNVVTNLKRTANNYKGGLKYYIVQSLLLIWLIYIYYFNFEFQIERELFWVILSITLFMLKHETKEIKIS
jgi:O-antigen ligase